MLLEQLGLEFVEPVGAPGAQRQIAPLRRERPGHARAQAGAGTGDQDLLPSHRHSLTSPDLTEDVHHAHSVSDHDCKINVGDNMGAVPCAACGHGMRATAKFCDECGASAQPSRPAERKQVTVLFGDVVGSMKLAATLDPESLREIMYDLFNRSGLIVQRYGGTVDKFTGDGLMALFGAPAALEDHALRAAVAALEIHIAAEQLAEIVRENVRHRPADPYRAQFRRSDHRRHR